MHPNDMPMSNAYLIIREGSKWADVFRLVPGESVTIGRGPTNAILVKDERCSRNHAEVLQARGAWLLLDLHPASALLLGAILAPTDPVLASSVTVGHSQDNDRLRYALSGEAGLNDGAAFPFVVLGLLLLGPVSISEIVGTLRTR